MEWVNEGASKAPNIFGTLSQQEMDAVTLLAAVHRYRDRETWGGILYWGQLEERCVAARSAGPDLSDWWSSISRQMGVEVGQADREEVAEIVATNNRKVLGLMGDNATWIVTLLRVIADHQRKTGATQ